MNTLKIEKNLTPDPCFPESTKHFVIYDFIDVEVLSYYDENNITNSFVYKVLESFPPLLLVIKELANYYNSLIDPNIYNKYKTIMIDRTNIKASSLVIDCLNSKELLPRDIYLCCNTDPILDLNISLIVSIKEEESTTMEIIIYIKWGGKTRHEIRRYIENIYQSFKFIKLFILMDRLERNNKINWMIVN